MATIDHLALKTIISTALSSVLGTYNFGSGFTNAAIRIEGVPGAEMVEPTSVTGLEVVIKINSDSDYTPMLGHTGRNEQVSEVILKQWDSTDDTNVARELLLNNVSFYPLVRSIQPRVPADEGFGNIEQQTIIISHF